MIHTQLPPLTMIWTEIENRCLAFVGQAASQEAHTTDMFEHTSGMFELRDGQNMSTFNNSMPGVGCTSKPRPRSSSARASFTHRPGQRFHSQKHVLNESEDRRVHKRITLFLKPTLSIGKKADETCAQG